MRKIDWHIPNAARLKARVGRGAAAVPACLAALGVAVAAGSTTRSDADRTTEAIARTTQGDLSPRGLAALAARLDPAQLALAIRHDPNERDAALYGLTPGWESLSLGGKPSLELGTSGLEAQKANAATPVALGALQPARPFVFKVSSEVDRRKALRCLTQAVYYESALESTEGQEGVAQVVLNRVRDPNYPDTICGVVFQGAERTTGCQFSFTCDGALAHAPVGWAWERSLMVAQRALAGHVATKVGTATHYHADYVHPWWSPTLDKITQIGAHIFYRWKGVYGETAAFKQAYATREPTIDEARFSRPRLMTASTADAEEPAGTDDTVSELKTVEIDGRKRVVGIVSLGGRRLGTPEEIAAINAQLEAFEKPEPSTPQAPAIIVAPAGVTPMAVEEVGKPAG